jgi:hypothetical protein
MKNGGGELRIVGVAVSDLWHPFGVGWLVENAFNND